ncbi:MAG: YihY/virulence factor BrkB family protein [Congregibacter sp.]
MIMKEDTNSIEDSGREGDSDSTYLGRRAESPGKIPARGWWEIARRVVAELGNDRVSLVAAGVGFFALLSAFPALGALVALVGLFSTSTDVLSMLESMDSIPEAVRGTLITTFGDLQAQPDDELGWAAAAGMGAALWSAKKGVASVLKATNMAYEEPDSRPWWRALLLSLAFTTGSIVLLAIVLALAVALPLWVRENLATGLISYLVTAIQWVLLWCFGAGALAILYRYAPNRDSPEWEWVSPGAALATTLWMVGSVGFGWYVQNASTYQETYGSLAGVIITMLWLYLTGYIVILGAEINSEIEYQTRRDTTVGPDEPMGQRDAFVADNVAPARD